TAITKHTAEVVLIIFQFHFIIQNDFQNDIHALVEQATFNGIGIELQELLNQIFGFFKLLQSHINQKFQFKNSELAPFSIFIELDTDQGFDLGIVILICFFQPLNQCFQLFIIQTVQIQDIFTI